MSNTTTGISVMGLDLGDRQSHFCLMDEAGEIVQEGTVGTNEPHLTRWACAMAPTRFRFAGSSCRSRARRSSAHWSFCLNLDAAELNDIVGLLRTCYSDCPMNEQMCDAA